MKTKKLFFVIIAFAILTFNTYAQVSFIPAANFAVSYSPFSIFSADFNGDGKTDLVTANVSNNVSVLLGDGIGGFANSTEFTVGNYPLSVISTDFNGDGKADLVTANFNSNNLSVLFGDGAGGFGAATNIMVGSHPNSVISADFNGDAKADLAVANQSDFNVSILLGDGLGSFGAATNFAVGSNPNSIISTDFNADGKTDLAVVNAQNISIFLGDGLGNFGTLTNFAISTGNIINADFNGDGKVDLAVAQGNSNNVSVLIGDGAGNFGSATTYAVGNVPRSIISSDFNGDGGADLAVVNENNNNVSILLGNGIGGFSPPSNFVVGIGPRPLTSADFNGDGKIDLAVANSSANNVSILINNSPPPPPPICLVTVDSSLTHNLVVWEKTIIDDLPAIDSFVVYREIATNNYQRLGAISKDSMSTFDDFAVNPATTGYRYKLKSKNTQGIESFFSDYHNTVYLTNTNTGGNFSWTPYQIENNITPVSNYIVYRDDNSIGNFQSIGNTTGNQLGYTDVNYSSFPNASYYVEAVMAGGICNPTRSSYASSRSNIKHIGSNGIQQMENNTSINIFPNPASNMLNITSIKGKTTLRLYDLVGKLVVEKKVENNTSINISLLTEGIYMLLTENETSRTFYKVVINR